MKKTIIITISLLLIILLPVSGILLSGRVIEPFLIFPPAAGYVAHKPFSWPVFTALAAAIIMILFHPVLHVLRCKSPAAAKSGWSFPWWGYAGICAGVISWIIAWTRLPLFHDLQRWTFVPLWISYIVTVNAICVKRTGRSLLSHRTAYTLSLFPLSAAFWWVFEYLNRFTSNWYYVGAGELSPLRYFLEATLAFSTVLPAVMSTADLIKGYPRLYAGLDSYIPVSIRYPRFSASFIMSVAGAGLLLVGVFPEWLFPLLWISPLLFVVSMQVIAGEDNLLIGIRTGDWRVAAVYPLAALTCGFFWEMWNIESQAKWIYSIPYVHGFKIFEMPILGYAGYLPFGLECAVIAGIFAGRGTEPWRF